MKTHLGVPDRVEQTAADILGPEVRVLAFHEGIFLLAVVGLFPITVREAAAVFGLSLGLALHPEHFPERARDRAGLEPDLAVVSAVDVADEHIDRGIVSAFGHVQHIVERPRAGQEAEQAPERAPS